MTLIDLTASYLTNNPKQVSIAVIGVMVGFHLATKRYRKTTTTIYSEVNVRTGKWNLPLTKYPVNPEDHIPKELVTLVGSELAVAAGDKMVRIDQLYMNKYGELVITDTKTRSRDMVKETDIEQLKRYKGILTASGQYGKSVANYGYIRVVRNSTTSREIRYLRVEI